MLRLTTLRKWGPFLAYTLNAYLHYCKGLISLTLQVTFKTPSLLTNTRVGCLDLLHSCTPIIGVAPIT